ncbi:MAG: NAD(P)H-binding protein [Nocardioidaceae bacterium]|nr:NAD(P)H-binding protein [Nocardioidaceae bacterium]
MRTRVAVVGASGKTGRAAADALLARGAHVVPTGRAEWADLAGALAGCTAVYVVAPNLHPDEPSFVASVLDAARAAGVGRVVHHSVASPYVPDMPHHVGKAVAEDLVRRSGLSWTLLQPCAYVQNMVPALRMPEPVLDVAYDPAARFGLVDLADVGAAAATVLLEDGHHGATYELGGPSLVTVDDVAATASTVLGVPVPVRRTTPAAWRAGADGLDPREADWLAAMFAYYDDHGLPTGPRPLASLLGRDAAPLLDTLARELTQESSAPR